MCLKRALLDTWTLLSEHRCNLNDTNFAYHTVITQ